MKPQKITPSLGFVLSIAHLSLFSSVMADLPSELRNLVSMTTRKGKGEVLLPRQEAEANQAPGQNSRYKRARISQAVSPKTHSTSQNVASEKPFHGIIPTKSWASIYIRPSRPKIRRAMVLEPIRTPTEDEVAHCLSPLTFTLPKTPAGLELVPKIFIPLSIHELFQFYGPKCRTDLQERGISLDRVIANALDHTHHTGPHKRFSPMLAYISVQISLRMGPWLEHYWHQIGSTFSSYTFSRKMDSGADKLLFLPFIYQLLSQKPTLKQWLVVENFFIVFLVYWKIHFLYMNQEIAVINEFETNQILEKKAKALIWISEVLSHMFVPDFLALICKEKVRLTEKNKSHKSKPRGARSLSAIERLFEYLAGITANNKTGRNFMHPVSTSTDVLRKRKIFSELLKMWQADCHNGFPVRAEKLNHNGVRLPLIAGPNKIKHLPGCFWDSWCAASIDISLQSRRFSHELKVPSPAFKNMNKMRAGERLFGSEIDADARQKLIDFEGAALEKSDEECANIMEYILNLIPKLPINLPGELNSPEVFDYFLHYDQFHLATPCYLPDQIRIFFHLKKTLGSDSGFWHRFEGRKHIRAREAEYYQRFSARKPRFEKHAPGKE